MSIQLPESNLGNNISAVGLTIPANASSKNANQGATLGFWIRTPINDYENNTTYNYISRVEGAFGGNDAFIQYDKTIGKLVCRVSIAGVVQISDTVANITLPTVAKTYLVMLIVNPTNYHLVYCEPGQAAQRTTVASSTYYAKDMSALDMWQRIGPGDNAGGSRAHYGPIEEAFLINGTFPETAGVPDMALIANIASGAQDLAALAAVMTGGVNKWRYRMLQQDTLTDSFALAGPLVPFNTSTEQALLSGGPLRPIALKPTYTLPMVSQVQFATAGVSASATTTIRTEGGTYTGTPFAIHARLRKEDASILRDWVVVDAAPSGGTWAPNNAAFTAVPMTGGWLTLDFKAVNSGGTQIGDIVTSYGLKGAGFNALCVSQSQGVFLWQTGNGETISSTMRSQMVSYDSANSRWINKRLYSANAAGRVGLGMVRAAKEIQALYPGVPVSFSNIGVVGQPITAFIPAGAYVGNWASYAAAVGRVQPYALYTFGFSSGSDASYETYLGSIVTQANTNVGTPIGILHCDLPRYSGAGNQPNETQYARVGIRNRCINNPTEFYATNMTPIKCDTNDTGPHPMDADVGQGRSGAMYAWGLMQWARAVTDTPQTLKSATKIATTVQLVIGPVQ